MNKNFSSSDTKNYCESLRLFMITCTTRTVIKFDYLMKILAAGQSEANRNNLVLCDKRKPVEFIAAYLKFQSIKKNCGHMKCILKYFCSEAENLKLCCQMQEGEKPVNKDHCVTMPIFIERLWGETWHKNRIEEFGWRRQRKIWIAALKFDAAQNGNSINARYYVVLFCWFFMHLLFCGVEW